MKPAELLNRLKESTAWSNATAKFAELRKLRPNELIERAKAIGMTASRSYGLSLRLGAAALAAYFLADTVSLFTDSLIPEAPAVPAPALAQKLEKGRAAEEYAHVVSRNIFNSKGLIPEDEGNLATGPARKSTLPLNLIGTVVLKNEFASMATIEDKTQNMIFPVRIDDTIADLVQITKIGHLRVDFINKSTGRLEYIDLADDTPILNMQPLKPMRKSDSGVNQVDETHVEVERNTIDRAASNLSDVLQQARAIPNFENGMPDGYKLVQIQAGSIYEKLGMKENDVLCGLNGESINDPGKAFQLFNELKSTSHVEICVKRLGKKMTMNYDIR